MWPGNPCIGLSQNLYLRSTIQAPPQAADSEPRPVTRSLFKRLVMSLLVRVWEPPDQRVSRHIFRALWGFLWRQQASGRCHQSPEPSKRRGWVLAGRSRGFAQRGAHRGEGCAVQGGEQGDSETDRQRK